MTTAFQSDAFQWNSFQIDLVLEVPAGSLTFAGQTGYTFFGTVLTPAAGTLTLSGKIPEASFGLILTPASGALALSGQVPSASFGLVLIPDAGSLTLLGQLAGTSFGTVLVPSTGSLVLAGVEPTFSIDTLSVSLTPDTGTLSFSGQVPLAGTGFVYQPPAGTLTLTGAKPARTLSDNRLFVPGTGRLRLSGKAPRLGAEKKRRSLYVIDPIGMSMRDWCDSMVIQLEPHSHSARLDDGNWQQWAAWFTTAPNLSQNHAPSPYAFDDWREWAKSFNNAMSPAGF